MNVCENSQCGMMWLDPQPLQADISQAYTRYYTHGAETNAPKRSILIRSILKLRKGFLPLWSLISPIQRERQRVLLMYLDKTRPGKLLDVGCGDGARLLRMKELGWEVQGQEIDPQAAAKAQEKLGDAVRLGEFKAIRYPSEYFDCITMNHVLEHVHDPVELLTECHRILKPGGTLVAVTPNAKSFGHDYFKAYWRGLEPPRHLNIFSPKAAEKAAKKAGFAVCQVWTTIANAGSFAYGGYAIKSGGHSDGRLIATIHRRLAIELFRLHIFFRFLLSRDQGEECVVWATR